MYLLNNKTNLLAIFLLILICGCGSSGEQTEPIVEVPEIPEVPVDETPVEMTTLKDGTEVETAALVDLGDLLFNDSNLSNPAGQSCASCHNEDAGFAEPNQNNPTSIGADNLSFGARNAPTASYAAFIPEPHFETRTPPNGGPTIEILVGGLFHDGRAESLEEQAKGPLLNPIEMGNASKTEVIAKIKLSSYANDFSDLFGFDVLEDIERSYDYVADAIAAYERTTEFSPFNSKFDQVQNGLASFTEAELHGQQLFNGKAQCDQCHRTVNTTNEIFSNFEYFNIGVPSNPLLPAFIEDNNFVDLGLGGVNGMAQDNGKFRTPTLRNISKTAPYMHNGVFNTLTEVVEFYNNRDSGFNQLPEVAENIFQGGRIGELGLTETEVVDLVAFLETLNDL